MNRHILEWERLTGRAVEVEDFPLPDSRLHKGIAATAAALGVHRVEVRDARHIAEWIKLADLQSAQVAPIESSRPDRRGHRPPSGINAASRELGIDKDDAHRAVNASQVATHWPGT